MNRADVDAPPYVTATRRSRTDRGASHDALAILEEALAAPTPSRESAWRTDVIAALDAFIVSLDDQARSDLGDESLLSEIAADQPRLRRRVERLHDEHADLRKSASSLRAQIASDVDDRADIDTADIDTADIDTADIRDRLSSIARRYRRHRAREADLVYEAINVDLGAGD